MEIADMLRRNAEIYNDDRYFAEDPIIFPKKFASLFRTGSSCFQDVEIAAVMASHLAWGRRSMIIRDCRKAFDEMQWKPYDYVMKGNYRNDTASLHRTVKWNEFASICSRLKAFYNENNTLEVLSPEQMRTGIFGSKSNPNAANKKIHMMRRWMVRDDGKVDLGLWKNTDKAGLIIPLDVHVHNTSIKLGITQRKSSDFRTASEITGYLAGVFPGDPVKGDFALFAVAASGNC